MAPRTHGAISSFHLAASTNPVCRRTRAFFTWRRSVRNAHPEQWDRMGRPDEKMDVAGQTGFCAAAGRRRIAPCVRGGAWQDMRRSGVVIVLGHRRPLERRPGGREKNTRSSVPSEPAVAASRPFRRARHHFTNSSR